MNLIEAPKARAVQSFLQQGVDPSDPEYKFHSQGIVDTLTQLHTDFDAEKTQVMADWTKAKEACTALKKSIGDEMTANSDAMTTLEGELSDLKISIAENQKSLVTAEAMLQDDQTYLSDVTVRCQTRGKEWDQRTQMRAEELEALSKALEILSGKVTEVEVVNERALVQHGSNTQAAEPVAETTTLAPVKKPPATMPKEAVSQPDEHALAQNGSETVAANTTAEAPTTTLAPVKKPPAPTPKEEPQLAKVQPHKPAVFFLQKASEAATQQKKQSAAHELLIKEGERLHKPVLSAIAAKVMSDPLGKVKTLIQDLIERLVGEATAEATKKGFCDTELGKAETDRKFRYTDVKKLSTDHTSLEAKRDTLSDEIATSAEVANSTQAELEAATTERAESKANNLEAIEKGKEGVTAVKEAIAILQEFYKGASKAKFLQIEASPVDEDTEGAGFDGAYKGKQDASTGIIGILEVLASDFQRTVTTTEAEEKKAQADFVDFDRSARETIAGQLKSKELNEQELTSTLDAITTTMTDIQNAQDMLDSALKSIEDLKPMCIDNVQSYEDRVAKREEEIAALTQALCMLDPNKVETECA